MIDRELLPTWRHMKVHAIGRTSMGISRLTVSKILNHVETGVTAVYTTGTLVRSREA